MELIHKTLKKRDALSTFSDIRHQVKKYRYKRQERSVHISTLRSCEHMKCRKKIFFYFLKVFSENIVKLG